MAWLITNFISAFLLPPLSLLILAIIGLFLWHKRPLLARALTSAAILLLWLLSTPFIAESLLQRLEGTPRTLDTHQSPADAIVVLGGGTYFHAPEYGGDTVSYATLQRLRYAANLHRETGKPILVTGGKPLGNSLSEGEQMKHVLEQEFNVPVQWVEDASNNTLENARFSYELLKPEKSQHIYLVSHAWHLPRAQQVFAQVGFSVTPAPTAFTTRYATDLLAFVPRASALEDSAIYFHEMIGMLWYRLKSNL